MKYRYIFIALFLMPLWFISLLIPRKKNIIVFGSWFGERYSDNPMYIYEYASEKTDFKCVWLTHKNSIINYLNKKEKISYKIWSLKGIWYSLNAGIVVVGSGKFDVNPFFINGAKIINLWHGAPMKRIAKSNNLIYSKMKDNIKKIFLPNIYEYNIDFVLSTSVEFDEILINSFDLVSSQIIKTGYPRNDVFFESFSVNNGNTTKVAYLPTFRDNQLNYNLFEQFGFEIESFKDFLKTYEIEVHIGTHFASDCIINYNEDKIKIIPNDEFFNINEFLKEIDIVITDYSGVYFDYLLTRKPIILAPFDLNFYENNCRELSLDYYNLECYGFANNWNEILEILRGYKLNNLIINNRKKKIKYNDYHKGKSTESLYDAFKKISKI